MINIIPTLTNYLLNENISSIDVILNDLENEKYGELSSSILRKISSLKPQDSKTLKNILYKKVINIIDKNLKSDTDTLYYAGTSIGNKTIVHMNTHSLTVHTGDFYKQHRISWASVSLTQLASIYKNLIQLDKN